MKDEMKLRLRTRLDWYRDCYPCVRQRDVMRLHLNMFYGVDMIDLKTEMVKKVDHYSHSFHGAAKGGLFLYTCMELGSPRDK